MENFEPRQASQSADTFWKTVHDAARGKRRLRLDGSGRVREVVQADGGRLLLDYDQSGGLRRMEGDRGFFLNLERCPEDATLAVADGDGRTAFTLSRGGHTRVLERGAELLAIELDGEERLRRVTLPGSTRSLLYDWHRDGSCEIGPEGGDWTVRLTGEGLSRRLEIAPGVGWEERLVPGGVLLAPFHGGAEKLADIRLRFDGLGRILSRTWGDSRREVFVRDGRGRLCLWERFGEAGERLQWAEYRFQGENLAATVTPAGEEVRILDDGGRVLALHRPDGSRVEYGYDACGRRTERREGDRRLRYEYDPLGRLRRITGAPDAAFELNYDGLGRRLSVSRPEQILHEHRDEAGRLWALTDGGGRVKHTFIWVGDRLAARLDGPVGFPVAEGYLCDPLGSLLAVLRPGEKQEAVLERLEAPPFGAVSDRGRPTLYGHFGLPEIGLIHFGARELDPELGLFLTPDPWHGGEDDPRRWAGAEDAFLRHEGELPAAGAHDYALCQFDPVGRADRDGHVSALVHLLRWILLPTWGMPLTSISVFFFMPLNIYMEVLGLLVLIFKQLPCFGDHSHPWGNHTIAKATFLLGSGRQFTFAFGLNGFLPRVVSGKGLTSDRAVTIGNVIWINREELARLDRREVIELWDIGGPPGGGGTRFNDNPARESVVGLLGIDTKGKKQLHVSAWSRGFGNAVAVVGGQQTLVDKPVPAAAGFAWGTLLLRKCFPEDFPCPGSKDDKERLEVEEYLFDAGTNHGSEGQPLDNAWFALALPSDTGFRVGHWLKVTAPKASPAVDPTFREIRQILQGEDHKAAFLRHELPARFQNANLKEKLKVQRVEEDAPKVASEGWNAVGGLPAGAPPTLEVIPPPPPAAPPAGWPPLLRKESQVKIVANTPAVLPLPPPLTPGAPEDTAFAQVKSVQVTLQIKPAPGAVAVPADLFLQRPSGAPFQGEVEPADPAKITFQGAHPKIKADDLLLVTRTGSAETAYVRAAAVTETDLSVDPSLTPAITMAGKTRLRLQKYEDNNKNKDKGQIVGVSGDEIDIDLDRSELFPENSLIRYELNANPVLRQVIKLKKVRIELTDEAVGNAPFTVSKAHLVEGQTHGGVKLAPAARFIRWTGAGTAPSAYGSHPNSILGIGSQIAAHFPDMSVFYLRWAGARPADFHQDFRRSWTPALADGVEYWILETPLPLVEKEDSSGTLRYIWRGDEETDEQDIFLGAVAAGPPTFRIREYTRSGTSRTDTAGRRILAQPPEVQVPVKPRLHDTHRRALIEHEIHHTVQGNFWGPLMGALPLQGILMLVADFIQATGSDKIPDWLRGVEFDAHGNPPATADGRIDHNTELKPLEVVSIGGLMQLTWKYIILGPLMKSDLWQDRVKPLDFSDWNKVFNPVSRLLTEKLPPVDPEAPKKERWEAFLGQLLERALDLRSWTPFLGFVPTLLPDGPRSFIEQGASQASGDLYSTILSANDRFNRVSKFIGSTYSRKKADLHPRLGEAVRLMLFASYRTHRVFAAGHGDRPGSPLTYKRTISADEPIVLTLPVAGSTALLHPELYEVRPSGGGAAPTHPIEGPARTVENFLQASSGDQIIPRLRSLVPSPPRVNRSCGFYFLPASHGEVRIDGYYAAAGAGDQDAQTQTVVLNVEDEVKLGKETVPWSPPPAHPATPATAVDRFLTEKDLLKMSGRNIDGMVIVLDEPAGGPFVSESPRADRSGWDLQVATRVPAAPVRVRLYRIFAKNDTAFDLTYENVPTLSGIRSYLDADLWIPVRDFHLNVQDLPAIADTDTFYDEPFALNTPIRPAAGERAITIVPPAGLPQLRKRRTGDHPPRGDAWKLGPLESPVEDDAVYLVTVTYGQAPHTVDRSFRLTCKPRIHLPNHAPGAPFEARKDHPLELDIAGGTAPYRVEADLLPTGSTVAIADGNRVVVTVNQPPPAERRVVVTVRDSADHTGKRTITLKP